MSVEIQPYFAVGERYPALIGVRAEGDEYETAYVSKSELVDALAENAKLQDELELANNQCERAILELLDQQGQLKAENARLRELVLVLNNCADENGDCDACPINNAKPVRHPWFGCGDTLRDMMRELGIEVTS